MKTKLYKEPLTNYNMKQRKTSKLETYTIEEANELVKLNKARFVSFGNKPNNILQCDGVIYFRYEDVYKMIYNGEKQ